MSAVKQLLNDYGALIGETIEQDESGAVVLESDGQFLALVPELLPDGTERLDLSLTTELVPSGDALDQSQLFYLLHRLNHEAVSAHGWRIALSEEEKLELRGALTLSGLTPELLHQVIDDGFARARQLAQIVDGLQTPEASATGLPTPQSLRA